MTTPEPRLRLAELMAALSLSTDAGMGLPFEAGQRTAILSVRLGEAVGLDADELKDAYYLGLLMHLGCAADAHLSSDFFGGDEKKERVWMAEVDWGSPAEFMGTLVRRLAADAPLPRRATAVVNALLKMPSIMGLSAAHCEVASAMASSCGFSSRLAQQLSQVFARWDGKGMPRTIAGEQISRPMRVAALAKDAEVFLRTGGVEAAQSMARKRRGGAYAPAVVDVFVREAGRLQAALDVPGMWDAVLAAEPGTPEVIAGARLEQAMKAIAAFSDLSSTYTRGHSIAVGTLAEAAGAALGLPASERTTLRHAGYLHDLGRMGVPTSLWEKPGPLTESERERVRLHAYYTERILARPAALAAIGALASLDHERLDGSGYHRRLPATALSPAARALAATDVYVALTEDRPHRPGHAPSEAAKVLESEARAGRLCPQAVDAVLAAAGHDKGPRKPAALPGGLSEREVEVLRLVTLGLTNKEVASTLDISARTVGHHLQHVYDKIGVSTRAAASLFAMQNDLCEGATRPHRG